MNISELDKADLLETEISILKRIADSQPSGMGNYYTAIGILEMRVHQLRGDECLDC